VRRVSDRAIGRSPSRWRSDARATDGAVGGTSGQQCRGDGDRTLNEALVEATGAALGPIVAAGCPPASSHSSRADAPPRCGADDRGGTPAGGRGERTDAVAGALRYSAKNARAVAQAWGLTTASTFILHG
jgi:hypothetical protein